MYRNLCLPLLLLTMLITSSVSADQVAFQFMGVGGNGLLTSNCFASEERLLLIMC
jgi:hypothetical protein